VNVLEPEGAVVFKPEGAVVLEPEKSNLSEADDELPPSRTGGSADPWHGLDDFEEG
jgi:hypothetical protein